MTKRNLIADILIKHGILYLKSLDIHNVATKTLLLDNGQTDVFFLKNQENNDSAELRDSFLLLCSFGPQIICLIDQFDEFDLGPVTDEVKHAMAGVEEIESILRRKS